MYIVYNLIYKLIKNILILKTYRQIEMKKGRVSGCRSAVQ